METIGTRLQRSLCFSAVAETGSFTAAAKRLGCSKAHVSRQVAQLESQLGAQLLIRSTRRLVLTPLGRSYAEHTAMLQTALDAAEQAVSASREEIAGLLRITAATSFGEAFLVDLVEAFRAAQPQVEAELDLSIGRRDLVADGYDFGFRSVRTVEEHLVARALGVIRDIPVAAPALFRDRPLPRHPRELAALPCIHNTHFRDDAEWVFLRGRRSEAVRVAGTLRINHFGAIRRAALLGAGVARLPRYLVDDALRGGELLHLLPDWDIHPVPVFLVHPQRRPATRLQQAFREHAIAWFEAPARRALLG
ncbi:LysR family transcriptional regulator [Pseudomarimonas salicorniae]|uniref:LysR family transcriptional regulator n=1 Tax=Pseudomarimonas salicorniae TaxID=2933270 RepID=A0ABT0GKT7_9GAMM|nr:LysR family transcriptional regulator [Lysobacter sp. CAU 1642]MCK7595033.1 LysR family transcriptional regulator [Lysobacter sp. CAU 1642]